MNVVMKSECCPLDRKRSLLVRLHKDGGVAGDECGDEE